MNISYKVRVNGKDVELMSFEATEKQHALHYGDNIRFMGVLYRIIVVSFSRNDNGVAEQEIILTDAITGVRNSLAPGAAYYKDVTINAFHSIMDTKHALGRLMQDYEQEKTEAQRIVEHAVFDGLTYYKYTEKKVTTPPEGVPCFRYGSTNGDYTRYCSNGYELYLKKKLDNGVELSYYFRVYGWDGYYKFEINYPATKNTRGRCIDCNGPKDVPAKYKTYFEDMQFLAAAAKVNYPLKDMCPVYT